MSGRTEKVTRRLLRRWGVPDPGHSKKSRGRVIIVGGSRRSPGAVVLAAESALRVGAGRVGLLVPDTVADRLGVAMPEAASFSLPGRADEQLDDAVAGEIASAEAVLVGPGFDDPDETRATLVTVARSVSGCLVLDAFALGVLPDIPRSLLPKRLILTPNAEEVARLRDGREGADLPALRDVAARYDAVVSCYGLVAAPDGRAWRLDVGGPGLGTSGSGDVLAGAVAGFAARGDDVARAAVWGTWAHARAGDRLTARSGLGFLARELAAELPGAVEEALR